MSNCSLCNASSDDDDDECDEDQSGEIYRKRTSVPVEKRSMNIQTDLEEDEKALESAPMLPCDNNTNTASTLTMSSASRKSKEPPPVPKRSKKRKQQIVIDLDDKNRFTEEVTV